MEFAQEPRRGVSGRKRKFIVKGWERKEEFGDSTERGIRESLCPLLTKVGVTPLTLLVSFDGVSEGRTLRNV